MYYKKLLESLGTWGVFRRHKIGGPDCVAHVCIASNITELDADRILAELGEGRANTTTASPWLYTSVVIQVVGVPRFDWGKVLEAFSEYEDVRLICVNAGLSEGKLPH
jgi:hypothetical protein